MDGVEMIALGATVCFIAMIGVWIWRQSVPKEAIERWEAQAPLELVVAERKASAASAMTPIGALIAVAGLAIALWALNLKIDAYGDGIANIDAIGGRGMLFTAGVGLVVIGAVMVCCGRVLTEVRRALITG